MTARAATRARQIALDATTIAVTIDAALRHIDDSRAGYPTSTPGAAPLGAQGSSECNARDCTNTQPCPDHNPAGVDTPVERQAFTVDQAARDWTHIDRLSRRITLDIALLANLTSKWGLTGINATDVKDKLKEAGDSIFCANCSKHGASNVKRQGGTECDFCARFRNDYAPFTAPAELVDIHDRRGRVNSADIARIMIRKHGPDWVKKLKKKPKPSAA